MARPFNNLATISAEARAEHDRICALPPSNEQAGLIDDFYFTHNFQRVVVTPHGMIARGPAVKLEEV
jgi:hypothetical protein